MTGKISEIFESIQGEGLYFGEKQLFVRLFGCNLKCKFCDTKQTNFTECSAAALFEKIAGNKNRYRFVSFTGGEPLLQNEFLRQILEMTHKSGFKNYLETNGTMADELADVLEFVDIISMDIKLPSSTGIKENLWPKHRKFLKVAAKKDTFLKAVVSETTTDEDLYVAITLIKEMAKGMVLVLQPNYFDDRKKLEPKLHRYKEACMKEGIVACIIPQMHKLMGMK
ncbi:MAG: 7-carboxy-7-deazaguanine synthase QueE [Candidatus Omnitrophota bacterium]